MTAGTCSGDIFSATNAASSSAVRSPWVARGSTYAPAESRRSASRILMTAARATPGCDSSTRSISAG
ncbi:hypothetical protein CIK06_18270 [Plantactinospora sp. KBS50]|nr:hypothetical protein CIK06_18270 [Plantactinospora sp. KBS50]